MINVCRILLLLIINSMLAACYFKDSDNIEHTINIEYALSNFSEPKLSEKYNSKEMKRVAALITEDSNPVLIKVKLN